MGAIWRPAFYCVGQAELIVTMRAAICREFRRTRGILVA
jgi:hypothetical protein